MKLRLPCREWVAMRSSILTFAVFAVLLSGVSAQPAPVGRAVDAPRPATVRKPELNPNILTAQETDAGWHLLFDGKSFDGWRTFRKSTVTADRWAVEEGCLHLYGRNSGRLSGGDLITAASYGNFEFAFEWMAGPGVNSGVKYLIDEYFAPNRAPVSFEYQIQVEEDPAKPKRKPIHSTGALYDMMPATGGVIRPAGMFNDSRIVVNGMHVEHWLNGEKVLEFDRGSAAFRELVARSKFWKWPGFGLNASGHLGLQDHGGEIWYRRLRIRSLGATATVPLRSSSNAGAPFQAANP